MAILEQRRVLESEPNFGLGTHFLGRSYLAAGDYTQALELLRKSDDLLGRFHSHEAISGTRWR